MSEKGSSFRLPPVVHLILLVSLALLVWGYWPGWVSAFNTWQSDPDYNHGFLVIPIAAWLLWQRRKDLEDVEYEGSWVGLVLIAVAVGFRIAGAEFFFSEFDTWSIPIWIAGVVLLFGGWQLLRWALGAIAFLWFMTPIPGRVTEILSIPLQKVSALLSTWTLLTMGQPAIRQGTTIMLDEHVLEVERACSGLRICYGIAALAVAYILLNRPGWIRSIILLALTIPIAILANSLRVTGTGLLFLMVSGEAAQKWSHDFAGFAMLPLAVFLLWLFRRLFDRFVDAFQDSPVTGSKMVLKYFSIIAVAGVGLMYWHGIQSEKAVETLVKVADRVEAGAVKLETEGNQLESLKQYNRALLSLDKYLRIKPDQADVAKRAAVLSEKLALTAAGAARSARLYETAWKLLPDESQLGVKCAEFALKGDQFSDAVKFAERLEKVLPKDHADYKKVFGIRLRGAISDAGGANPEYDWTDVETILKSGLEQNIDPVQCVFQLAVAYQEKAVEGVTAANREQKAADLFTALLKNRSEDPLAWYAHSVVLKQYPRIARSGSDDSKVVTSDTQLDEAIRLASLHQAAENLPVWLAAGTRALSAGNLDQAKLYFENAIKADPKHVVAYLQLSRIVSGMAEDVPNSKITEQQHRDAVVILKSGLQVSELESNVLLRVELLRHQLRLVDTENQAEAAEQIRSLSDEFARLTEVDRAPLVLELALIEAMGLADRGDLQNAVQKLGKALEDPLVEKIPKGPGLLSQVWDAMGTWYSRLGQREKAVAAFARAREAEPRSVSSLNRSAMGAEALNQPDEAAKLYGEMLGLMGDRADLWIAKARSELRSQLNRAPQNRDFAEFNTAMQKAGELRASSAELAVLQAELLIAQQGDSAGLQFLEEQLKAGESGEPIWRALAVLRQRSGNTIGAENAFQEVVKLNKNVVETAFLKSELMLVAGKPTEARQVLADLLQSVEEPLVRQRVEQRLLELTAVTSVEAAEEMLTQDVAKDPSNLEKQSRLAELRWARRNLSGLEESEKSIRTVEGDGGTIWKELRARRLLEQARVSKDLTEREKLKAEAEQLIADLTAADPTAAGTTADNAESQALRLLKARLALLNGRVTEAAGVFESIWKDGLRSAPLAVELLQTLAAAGDMSTVRTYLGQMQDLIAVSPPLFDIAMAVEPATITAEGPRFTLLVDGWEQSLGNSEGALRAARLRRLRMASEPAVRDALKTEAEQAYRRAVELDPANPQAWGEYLLYVSRDLNDPERMVRELDAVNAESRLAELDRAFITAQLLSDVQLKSLSLYYWRKAIALSAGHPDSSIETRVLTLAAIAHFDLQPEAALKYARKTVTVEPENKNHRQFLTMILNEINVPGVRTEAPVALKEWLPNLETISPHLLTDEQKRLAAWVLYRSAVTPTGDVQEESKPVLTLADSLLKGIKQQTADDILLTGQIMIANGDEASGMRILNQRMQLPDTPPATVKKYIDFCRERFAGKPVPGDGVERTLSAMERRAGEQVFSLDFRLSQSGLTTEDARNISEKFIVRIVAARTEKDGQRELLQSTYARILNRGFFEAWLTLIQEDHPLIQDTTRLEAATLSLLFNRQDDVSEKRYQDYLQVALKTVNGPQLDRIAADYYFSRMLWKESEAFYQKCLKRNAKDTAAMNNMALAIAELRQDFTAAHALLDKALQIMQTEQPDADHSFLLDSKSLLQLAEGKAEESVPVLEALSKRAISDSSTWLHLAEGYRLQGKLEESRTAFEKAVDIGLNVKMMQPIDRRFFDALTAAHGMKPAAEDAASLPLSSPALLSGAVD